MDESPDALQRFMEEALLELQNMEPSWPFRDPVDPKEVRGEVVGTGTKVCFS